MRKKAGTVDPQSAFCEVCLKGVPVSEASMAEGRDFIAYFCGNACYDRWHARVELLLWVERRFGVALPENALQQAETPRDLLAAPGSACAGSRPPAPLTLEDVQAEPAEAGTLLEVLDWHLREHADRTQIIFLSDAGEEEISYAALKAGAAASGRSLAFFPEGTFTRVSALRPFHLGAFAAAVTPRDLARAGILRHCGEPGIGSALDTDQLQAGRPG